MSLCALFAIATSFNNVKNAQSNSAFPEALTSISFSEGNFSGTNGFEVLKSGIGFTADSTYPNAFNISDTTSYLEIKPNATTSLSGENGFSIALNISNKEGLEPNSYEQLFTVEGENGKSAHINMTTLYYLASSSSSTTYAVPNGGSKLKLNSSKKHQVFVVDFDADSIFCYVNGTLLNKFTPENSKADVISNVIDTFKLLKDSGKSLYLRKPCIKKTGKNTSSIIAANIEIYNSIISAEQATMMIEKSSKEIRNDLPIAVDSCDGYTIISSGYGINAYDSEKPSSFNIGDITSYLTIKADDDKKLVQNGKGFSFSFFHKSTTDTYYSGNTSLRPNVTDDFEQLLTVNGPSGSSAHICTGGVYYSEDGVEYSYKFADPSGSSRLMLTTSWKYVTINVNFIDNLIQIYIDGELAMYFDKNAATVKNIISLFSTNLNSLGGELFIRKPLVPRVNRNSATNVFDDVLLSEYKTEAEIKALHDLKLGKIRITFSSNVDVIIPDIVGTGSLSIPNYEEQIEGFNFSGFYFDQEHTQLVPNDYVFTESATIYAYFVPISYNITYHLDGGINGDNPLTYTKLDEITFAPAAKEGYIFVGWYRTEKYENKVEKLVQGSYGDIDLYAKFVRQTYTIEYVLNGGLLIDEVIETYTIDDGIIALPEAWKPNYIFEGWYLEEDFVNKIENINCSNAIDLTIYAKFVEPKDDDGEGEGDSSQEEEPKDGDEEDDNHKPNKNNNTGLIIGLSIGGGTVILGGLIFFIIKMVLRRKK